MNSFRAKIALLSGLVSGILLIGSAWFLWERTYQTNLEQIDRVLQNLGHANLERQHGHNRYIQLDQALNFIAATNSAYIVHFESEIGRAFHTSTNWPAELPVDSFPILTNSLSDIQFPPPIIKRGRQDPEDRPSLPLKVPLTETRVAGERTWRLMVMGNPYQRLILGTDIAQFESGVNRLRNTYLRVIPGVLLLVGIGSWLIAGRAMRPVTDLTRSVENITSRGLDKRIDLGPHDAEFRRLGTVFNQMMDRLEKSFEQAIRFSADASHELMTPLTIMQGEIEQTLQKAGEGSELQQLCCRQLEEIQRLKRIAQKLLLLAHADAGTLARHRTALNLSSLVREIFEDMAGIAPELDSRCATASDITVNGDPTLLRQAVRNLTVNALKYNRAGGRMTIAVDSEGGFASVTVANTGPIIPPGEFERIFERFYRRQSTGAKITEGSGLGLSLAREIARAHGGDLRLIRSDVEGSIFRLTLPI
jgi:two-component system heavy metal sensor histidine kinase CusS